MQVREHLKKVAELRSRIRRADESVKDSELRDIWDETRFELNKVRLFGDLVVSAFFEGRKARERHHKHSEYAVAVVGGEADRYGGFLFDRRNATPPRARVKWCVNNSGGDLLPLRDR